jgi:hypothetical protein
VKLSVLAIIAVALCLMGCGKPSSVVVTDYGIYTADVTTHGDWTKGIPVEINSVEHLKEKEAVTRVPCRDKINFGWRCHVSNGGLFSPILVTYSITHPPIAYPDGTVKTEEGEDAVRIAPRESADLESMWYFLDSCPHEYVPGPWTFRIKIDGTTAAEKTFDVYKP